MPDLDDQRINNLRAFLDAIAMFESDIGPRGYRMLYGGGEFTDFTDHPALPPTNWPGVLLPDELCAKAGLGRGCKSTAAGRYQITQTTWKRVRNMISVPDFSPTSQDAAAIYLLGEVDALQLIEAGQFEQAVVRARRIWASMPGAGYGQGEHAMDKWRDAYASAGGVVA